jgi:murein DD-endopeptidase MepM/ murein hydrolase activator NlpD
MKRWTVMLIPHGQGNTKSLNLYALQLYGLVLIFAALSFTTAFSFQTVRAAHKDIDRLEREKREIGAQATPVIQAPAAVLSEDERAAIEQKVREEYEARMTAITSELSELYDVEKNFRKNNGLPPRSKKAAGYVENVSSEAGGKGGAPSTAPDDDVPVASSDDALVRPPTVIDGLANPSADLIVQEINIRTDSLREYNELYLAASESKKEEIDRTPGIWPVGGTKRAIVTSRYGYRKDPFTRDLSFHDGLDIGAPYGSPIIATGKGKVIFSGWDKYLGNCVRVDHGGGMVTVYGHMQKTTVSMGDVVVKGTEVGKLGSTGRSTGAHVHYEVRINGKAVDPERYLAE